MQGLPKTWQKSGLSRTSAIPITRLAEAALRLRFCYMLRRYWSIGLVALLISVPLSAQQADSASSGQASSKQGAKITQSAPAPIAPAMSRVAYKLAETHKDQSDAYGDERNEREKRNLIAQEESAKWSQANFLAMVAQTVVAGLALAFLIMDLRQNRKSAESQLRAYITIEPGGVNEAIEGQHRMPYNIINNGQTPAYDLAIFGDILIVHGNPRDFNPVQHGRVGDAEATTDITLGPGQNQWNFAYPETKLFKPHLLKIDAKESAIIHYGFLQYRDVFKV